jgi:RNA recognition motif-containing protein
VIEKLPETKVSTAACEVNSASKDTTADSLIKTVLSPEDTDPDERSVFVKNVHFKATAQDLKDHFKECGEIIRVTIPIDKATNLAKG